MNYTLVPLVLCMLAVSAVLASQNATLEISTSRNVTEKPLNWFRRYYHNTTKLEKTGHLLAFLGASSILEHVHNTHANLRAGNTQTHSFQSQFEYYLDALQSPQCPLETKLMLLATIPSDMIHLIPMEIVAGIYKAKDALV